MKNLDAKPIPDMTPSDVARFWSHVEVGAPNECWPWKLSKFSGGYGQIKIGNRSVKSHRVAFKLFHGRDPVGAMVRHTCDNPPCCNGGHLIDGTGADNQADCIERGRKNSARGEFHGSKTHPERWARGERVANSVLTAEQVTEMRTLYLTGTFTQQRLADRFGVKRETVGTVLRGDHWGHLPVDRVATEAMRRKQQGRPGSANSAAKLSEDNVRLIRALYDEGGISYGALATRFGVTRGMIASIVKRRSWQHVG